MSESNDSDFFPWFMGFLMGFAFGSISTLYLVTDGYRWLFYCAVAVYLVTCGLMANRHNGPRWTKEA